LGVRIATLNTILHSNRDSLSDPATQRALSSLLERESKDPQWEGKAEFLGYEEYYDSLSSAVQQIAVQHHSAEAWKVLLRSNYNDDSRFAKWIAAQSEALDYLFTLSNDKNEIVRARASFVLAEALARCEPALQDQTCAAAIKKRSEILQLLRRNAKLVESPAAQLSAVRGLGICGTREDLDLLGGLAGTNTNRWFALFVHKAEQQIQDREKKN
jgi:hypothetical protein